MVKIMASLVIVLLDARLYISFIKQDIKYKKLLILVLTLNSELFAILPIYPLLKFMMFCLNYAIICLFCGDLVPLYQVMLPANITAAISLCIYMTLSTRIALGVILYGLIIYIIGSIARQEIELPNTLKLKTVSAKTITIINIFIFICMSIIFYNMEV